MGRQEQWEAYQDMTAKYREACDELRQALADLDEARALPKKVWIVMKNGQTILGVFDTKAKAVSEKDSWVVPFTDESFEVKEYVIR